MRWTRSRSAPPPPRSPSAGRPSPSATSSSGCAPRRPDMAPPVRAALAAADAVDRALALLCRGVLLLTGLALIGVMSANVVARYVLATGGFDWAEEVPQQLFPW